MFIHINNFQCIVNIVANIINVKKIISRYYLHERGKDLFSIFQSSRMDKMDLFAAQLKRRKKKNKKNTQGDRRRRSIKQTKEETRNVCRKFAQTEQQG